VDHPPGRHGGRADLPRPGARWERRQVGSGGLEVVLSGEEMAPVTADTTAPVPGPRPEPGWSSRSEPPARRRPERAGTRSPGRPAVGLRPPRRSGADQPPAPHMHQTASHPVGPVPPYAIRRHLRPQCRQGDATPGDPVPRRARRPAALRDQGVAGSNPVSPTTEGPEVARESDASGPSLFGSAEPSSKVAANGGSSGGGGRPSASRLRPARMSSRSRWP